MLSHDIGLSVALRELFYEGKHGCGTLAQMKGVSLTNPVKSIGFLLHLSCEAFNGYLCARKLMDCGPNYVLIADVESLIYSVLIKLTVEALEG